MYQESDVVEGTIEISLPEGKKRVLYTRTRVVDLDHDGVSAVCTIYVEEDPAARTRWHHSFRVSLCGGQLTTLRTVRHKSDKEIEAALVERARLHAQGAMAGGSSSSEMWTTAGELFPA